MITITILQDHEDAVGFHCIGHSVVEAVDMRKQEVILSVQVFRHL